MAKKSALKAEKPDQQFLSLDEITTEAEKALVDLDASLTAAGALIELTLSDGHSLSSKLLYKRMMSLDFLVRQAGSAEDIVWVAVNQVGIVSSKG